MKNVLTYEVDGKYLSEREELLKNTLSKWLKEQGFDVIVSSFCFDEMGSINIDCEMNKKKIVEIKKNTERLLDRLGIEYNLIEF